MNSKIEIVNKEYKWKKFHGFSLLFSPKEGNFDGNLLSNKVANASPFHKTLHQVFKDFSSQDSVLSHTNKFLKLDFASWHITVWDGINGGNFDLLQNNDTHYFSRFMQSLEYSDVHHDIRDLIEKSIRWMNSSGQIRFAFRKLYNFENRVLVISLKPADLHSLDSLHKIKLIRRNLNKYFEENFGLPTGKRYLPHISLGYFVEEQSGKDFAFKHNELNTILEESLKGKTIDIDSVGLFGFSDMITFFKY